MYENAQKTAKSDTVKTGTSSDGAKTDRVSISAKASQNAAALRAAKADATEIENAANPERLAQIANQVSEGSYYVPTDKLAGAILNTIG